MHGLYMNSAYNVNAVLILYCMHYIMSCFGVAVLCAFDVCKGMYICIAL